jgi:hypothetical protein
MKDFLTPFAFAYVAVLFIFLFVGTMAGIGNDDSCATEVNRIEVLIPTFRLGCWLGGDL